MTPIVKKSGGTHLRGKPLADGDYHLVVNIWVYNSRGQVLLTQRHPDIPFGLKWACTGGSAIAGEDTLTAAVRETREEIGLTVQPQELILAGQERRLHSFLDTFILCRDVGPGEIVMQPEEVVDFCWVGPVAVPPHGAGGAIAPRAQKLFHHLPRKDPQGQPLPQTSSTIRERKTASSFLFFCACLKLSLFDKNFPFRQPAIA